MRLEGDRKLPPVGVGRLAKQGRVVPGFTGYGLPFAVRTLSHDIRQHGSDVLGDPAGAKRHVANRTISASLHEEFRANLEVSGHTVKVTVLKGRSQEKMKLLRPESFDLIYVDGSHYAWDVMADAVSGKEEYALVV